MLSIYWLRWSLLNCFPGWPQTLILQISTSWLVGLQMWATVTQLSNILDTNISRLLGKWLLHNICSLGVSCIYLRQADFPRSLGSCSWNGDSVSSDPNCKDQAGAESCPSGGLQLPVFFYLPVYRPASSDAGVRVQVVTEWTLTHCEMT